MTAPTVYFAGTGAQLLFSLGVAKYLKEYYPSTYDEDATVLTVSGGGIAAVALLSLPLEEFDTTAARIAQLFDQLPHNPFSHFQLSAIYRHALEVVVTEEALPLLRQRLLIATTQLPSRRRRIYSEPFLTVREVVEDLQASAYIPFYFLRFPYRRHLLEIDGGASQSEVDLTASLQVYVEASPEADVFYSANPQETLRFRAYEENMALYEAGYQRASESTVAIEAKLYGV